MIVELFRWGSNQKDGTHGEIVVKEDVEVLFKSFTVEQPWNNNEPFKSCIPSGQYTLEPYYSPKYGHTFCVVGGTIGKYEGEAERFAILLHSANKASQLHGCIAPGESRYLDPSSAALCVGKSRKTIEKLLPILNGEDGNIPLIIHPVEGF